MAKTEYHEGNPMLGVKGTKVTAAMMNALNNQRHDGQDIDGHGVLTYAVTTGTPTAYQVVFNPPLASHIEGMPLFIKFHAENTGPATLQLFTLPPVPILTPTGEALAAKDITAGRIVQIIYDGTGYQLLGAGVSGGGDGVPIGMVEAFAAATPPAGYLVCNGAAVGRDTYPELFAVIGTVYGAGNGATTFNLPDLRGEDYVIDSGGSSTSWYRKYRSGWVEQGGMLQNVVVGFSTHNLLIPFFDTYTIMGSENIFGVNNDLAFGLPVNIGAVSTTQFKTYIGGTSYSGQFKIAWYACGMGADVPIIDFLPCIKAFNATVNEGLVDITELANDVAELEARDMVVDSWTASDGSAWYRKYRSGWIEQGGVYAGYTSQTTVNLVIPFKDANYTALASWRFNTGSAQYPPMIYPLSTTQIQLWAYGGVSAVICTWYACGQGL